MDFDENSFYIKYIKYSISYPLYFINLNRSTERRNNMYKTLSKTNSKFKKKLFDVHRINAIDGKLKNYATIMNSSSEIACTLSHIKAINTAYANNNEFAFICEDDIDLDQFYINYTKFIECLQFISAETEIIQGCVLDIQFYNSCEVIKPWKSNYYGTQLYIISRKGMKKILETNLIKYYQNAADYLIYKNAKTVSITIPLCKTQYNESTIHSSHLTIHEKCMLKQQEKINSLVNLNELHKTFIKEKSVRFNGQFMLFTSIGDNSLDAYKTWINDIKKSKYKIDLVCYYYGNNEVFYKTLEKLCTLVVKSKGLKFDNFYKFYWTYKTELAKSNYKYVAVFDDDIVLKSKKNPFDVLFDICLKYTPTILGPSCQTDKDYTISFLKHTHKIKYSLFHYVSFIETNTPIFKWNCLRYLMLTYNYKQIPSLGSEFWYTQVLNTMHENIIVDIVEYLNPIKEEREITKYDSELNEVIKWILYSINNNLTTFLSYTIHKIVYQENISVLIKIINFLYKYYINIHVVNIFIAFVKLLNFFIDLYKYYIMK
jgi:GR25 family glycosyltransferase involved in LPS biosynthesis